MSLAKGLIFCISLDSILPVCLPPTPAVCEGDACGDWMGNAQGER